MNTLQIGAGRAEMAAASSHNQPVLAYGLFGNFLRLVSGVRVSQRLLPHDEEQLGAGTASCHYAVPAHALSPEPVTS